MKRYQVPARKTRAEITVINSRFTATLAPAFSVEEARDFIDSIKTEFSDATHNVPAFIIGHGASVITHSSDDGEPSGTAGRPALAVLTGSGLGDAVVVVTRYFGGTKLGTGGLVRAYSDAVRAVIEAAPRAEKITVHTVMVAVPYNLFERLQQYIPQHHGRILDQVFAADVTVTAQFPTHHLETFQDALRELSHGTVTAEVMATEDIIAPLDEFGLAAASG